MSTLEKIENAVVEGYKNIENAVVEGYKKIEKGAVEGFEKVENGIVEKMGENAGGVVGKMADAVTEGYKKIEDGVVGKFEDMSDAFVEKHLLKEGETVEEAKARLAKEQADREAKAKSAADVKVHTPNVNIPNTDEIVKKSLEASMNAGKRN